MKINLLNENNIQWFVGYKIKLGLFFNDNLVSLMTFDKNEERKNGIIMLYIL